MSETGAGLSVTILGSGTCVPSLERSSCAVLIETGGEKLLFDSGPGTMRRLLEAGSTIFEIGYIFYSHFHPDHTAELVPFLFATKYPNGAGRKAPLTIVAGKGFLDFYQGLKRVYGTWIELPPGDLRLIEMDAASYDVRRFERFTVESTPVVHREESIAFRISGKTGKSVVYSGDTDFSENLVSLAKGADLFICESALPDRLRSAGHLCPSLAGEMATRAGVKRLVLTHFYPVCDHADMEKECRKTYGGPLVLAEDLMRFEVGSSPN